MNTIEAERNLLRALCTGAAEASVLLEATETLASYAFAEPLHQIIFDVLVEIGPRDPCVVREQLAVRLNNKGFPDLDLETFFAPSSLTAGEAIRLTRASREASFTKFK